jgi:archaemetzincin
VAQIALWWIGETAMADHVLDDVRTEIERALGSPARIWAGPERPAGTLDAARGQHSSTGMLRWLATARPAGSGPVVAVTDVDLFIPVLTFVFGEAALGRGLAVVSMARLGAPAGTRFDRRRLVARLAKECIHELGHAFGLVHCVDPGCVMTRSASLVQVDAKGGALCRNCRVRLGDLKRREGGAHG